MNILDEDIDRYQRGLLEGRGIHVRQIGVEIGRSGMKDLNEVIPLLHGLRRSTPFTRDHSFYRLELRHPRYCLVHLDVRRKTVADFITRFLRHPAFRTQAQRLGKVVRVQASNIGYWQMNDKREHIIEW